MLDFLKGPFLVQHFSYYTYNDLPDYVICNIAISANDTTLYSQCGQTSDLWQELELVAEFESGLQDTVDWDRKYLVDFNAGKTQLVSFDCSNDTGPIDLKNGWVCQALKSDLPVCESIWTCNNSLTRVSRI